MAKKKNLLAFGRVNVGRYVNRVLGKFDILFARQVQANKNEDSGDIR